MGIEDCLFLGICGSGLIAGIMLLFWRGFTGITEYKTKKITKERDTE